MFYTYLPPLRAIERIIWRGLSAELSYDNFVSAGGKLIEDRYMEELIKVSRDLIGYISAIHLPYDELEPQMALTEMGLKRLIKWLDLAHKLEIEIAVIHPLKIERSNERAQELNTEFLQKIIREAEERWITIAVENKLEGAHYCSKPEELLKIMKELSGDVGICLDLGHAHINGGLEKSLYSLSRYITAIHAHDNDGHKDLHMPPYTGTINWNLVENWIKKTRFNGVIIFEVSCKSDVQACDRLIEEVKSTPIANI